MKKIIVLGIGMIMVLGLLPDGLWAWCWIRESFPQECAPGSHTYVETCCDDYMLKWAGAGMSYQISTATAPGLWAYIRNGTDRWNNVAMSVFTFTDGGTTPITSFGEDGVNLINIDSAFCIHNPTVCGQGILGYSGVLTTGSGATFRAVESDIVLNGQEYVWGSGAGNTIDTEAVIAHEAGHSAGLNHPGDTCRPLGSAGCGPEVPEATMYYALNVGVPTDKATLELDDVAALVYGYPRSSFRVRVVDEFDQPLSGAEVELLDSAAPVNGTNSSEGGSVYGDVTNGAVLFGDRAASNTYVAASPFNATDANGYTNYINPVHQNIRLQVTDTACDVTDIQSHGVAEGPSELVVPLTLTGQDHRGPALAVTSHANNQSVNSPAITLQGTASDAGSAPQCENGVLQVTVDGNRANNDTAVGNATANWSADVALTVGANHFIIVATDDSAGQNTTTVNLTIIYDNTPPTVLQVSPADGATDVSFVDVISVQFSEAMNASTITAATFTVDHGVTGTITYDAGTHTATLTPGSPLGNHTTYTVTLNPGITDAAGNPLAGTPYSWSFTTVDDLVAPTVVQVSPPDGTSGAGASTVFWVRFSEAMNAATLDSSTFSVDNGVSGSVTYNNANYTAMFYPSQPLSYSTTYTVTLSTGIRDFAGNQLANSYNWSITTAAAPSYLPRPMSSGTDNGSGGGCFIGLLGSLW